MALKIQNLLKAKLTQTSVYLLGEKNSLSQIKLTDKEKKYISKTLKSSAFVRIQNLDQDLYFVAFKKVKSYLDLEWYRTQASKVLDLLNAQKHQEVQLIDLLDNQQVCMAVIESMVLSNYQFLKYFSDKQKRLNTLKTLLVKSSFSKADLEKIQHVASGVSIARDLVNEPLSYLTAPQISKEMKALSKQSGFDLEVFSKKKIQALKMGGLLAVNKGSIDPPTFNIMQWKPKNAKNKKPVVLVGKGVVYDTGGLSLKPTKGSMDEMKCDMGGAATVIGAMYAVAKNKLPLYVIGLVPATDNRPGGNAYAPGDVIKMYSGKTVEVLNTDAEGRMLLADALAYAQKYDPSLVLDFATLTGSAQRAVGNAASVTMGTAADKFFDQLADSGEQTYERVVRFPFWQEYADMIKSTIADVKNVGGPFAGAITAGKFLEVFTKDKNGKAAYPWMHLDIAGPAFLSSKDSYRGKEGTGYGVRLMYDFLCKMSS